MDSKMTCKDLQRIDTMTYCICQVDGISIPYTKPSLAKDYMPKFHVN